MRVPPDGRFDHPQPDSSGFDRLGKHHRVWPKLCGITVFQPAIDADRLPVAVFGLTRMTRLGAGIRQHFRRAETGPQRDQPIDPHGPRPGEREPFGVGFRNHRPPGFRGRLPVDVLPFSPLVLGPVDDFRHVLLIRSRCRSRQRSQIREPLGQHHHPAQTPGIARIRWLSHMGQPNRSRLHARRQCPQPDALSKSFPHARFQNRIPSPFCIHEPPGGNPL